MLGQVLPLFRQNNGETGLRMTVPGQRIYAIGEVHGRLDLLGELIGRIRNDNDSRDRANTTIVQLGNLVGGGGCSAELVRKFMNFTARSPRIVVLKGRCESMMAEALTGNPMMFGLWLLTGGNAILASWGVNQDLIASKDLPRIFHAARVAIPQIVLEWLGRLPLSYRSGDYIFVPAGARPELAQTHNRGEGLLSIDGDLIVAEHERNRLIALGLGRAALRTNHSHIDMRRDPTRNLTSLGTEGTRRWTLQTGPDELKPREAKVASPFEQADAGQKTMKRL